MSAPATSPIVLGRYAMFDRIAAGGMATVHLGRLVGQGGFARTVAIKRLHPQYAFDPDFVAMFLDEARLAARIRHPNVVPTLDVVTSEGEPFLVMEYVEGESLSTLLRTARVRRQRVASAIAAGVMVQVLHGLHAAHDARSDHGEPLEIVHRDVSPQNVLVGSHGIVRVLDFGVAKALGKLHTTRQGQLKGKLGYLAPEQVLGHPVTRRSDVFAAAVVLWEALAGRRLFEADNEGAVLRRILEGSVDRPAVFGSTAPEALEAVVMRALAKEPAERFDTALAMAEAIEKASLVEGPRAIGAWIRGLVEERLAARARLLEAIESSTAASLQGPTPAAARAARVSLQDGAPADGRATGREGHAARSWSVRSWSRTDPVPTPRRRARWLRAVAGGALLASVAAGSAVAGRVVDPHRLLRLGRRGAPPSAAIAPPVARASSPAGPNAASPAADPAAAPATLGPAAPSTCAPPASVPEPAPLRPRARSER